MLGIVRELGEENLIIPICRSIAAAVIVQIVNTRIMITYEPLMHFCNVSVFIMRLLNAVISITICTLFTFFIENKYFICSPIVMGVNLRLRMWTCPITVRATTITPKKQMTKRKPKLSYFSSLLPSASARSCLIK